MCDTISYKDFIDAHKAVMADVITVESYWIIPPDYYQQIAHAFHKKNRKNFMARGKHGLKRPR